MLFEPLKLSDKKKYDLLLKKHLNIYETSEGSELCFASLFAWKDAERLELYEHNSKEYLIIKGVYRGKTYFLPPLAVSKESFTQALNDLKDYCEQKKIFLIIYEMSSDFFERADNDANSRKLIPYYFDLITYENRDLAEYIYLASDLRELKGRKYHAKRNHLTKFFSTYNYVFRKYHDGDFPLLINNLKLWDTKRKDDIEITAITHVLENIDSLNANCDLLFVDDILAAFTVWSKSDVNADYVYVLFEKANSAYEGIFPAINNLCAKENFSDITFCNRQEDMGITNLRKSKLSYHPDHLSLKYTLVSPELINKLKALYHEAFPDDNPTYTNYFFSKINYHQIEYLEDNKEILSVLYLIPKTFKFFDLSLESFLIVGLATAKNFQHMGKCTKLLEKTFLNLDRRNISFVYLYPHPVSRDFYYRFGFGLMNYLHKPNNEPHKVGQISDVITLYNIATTTSSFYLERTRDDFAALNDKISAYNGEINLYSDGYQIISSDGVEESLFLSKKPTELGMMVRIIDLKSILNFYKYPHITNKYSVKFVDHFIKRNNIIVSIELNDGNITITEANTFDYEIDIIEITEAIFLGNKSSHGFLKLFANLNVLNNDKY